MSRGHVFVVHGDLTQLACDDVIVPAGPGFEVSASFLLDRRYEHLLTSEERVLSRAVTQLGHLRLPGGAAGRRVHALLQELGLRP